MLNETMDYSYICVMIVKKAIQILLTAAAITGCTGKTDKAPATGPDSRYTYSYIIDRHMREPERCLALIDTAEMLGTMSADSCNWLRGHIYRAGLTDYVRAEQYLRLVLDREGLSHTSDIYLTALSTYCTFSLTVREYARALEYATEGERLAHEAGNARFEAEFCGIAGSAIEHEHPGAGIEYLDRAIDHIRHQSDRQLLPKASYYMSEKTHILLEQGQCAEAAATCRERLAFIGEMQQLGVDMFDGYFDIQYARTYARLALSLQRMGQTAEASRAAKEFAKTNFAKAINGKHDILHYYVLTDDRPQVMQLFHDIEDFYVSQGDTINNVFHTAIIAKAQWHRRHREWREADQAAVRAAVLKDSLSLRARNRQAAEFEVKFKTQEKEIALAKAEASSRIHLIIIISLIVLVVAGAITLWQILVSRKQLHQKNRELYDAVQQMLQKEEMEQEIAQRNTHEGSLTPSQLLYRKACDLMREQKLFTDSSLNREKLARILGTNYLYISDAIRDCSGMTVGDFLDDHRILYAAQLLATTDEPVGIISDLSGFASRSHFNTLFREKFKMTPTEYRQVAKEKAKV